MTDKQHFVEAVLETVADYAEAQRLVRLYNTDEMVAELIGVEIKLLYDSADAVANGKDTSGDGRQNPAVTPAKLPDRT